MNKARYIISILSFCIPFFVYGADIRVVVPYDRVGVGTDIVVDVFLTTDVPVNAVEGEFEVSPDVLAIHDVRDGNSLVNFWVERPVVVSNRQVRFSGIIPGGLSGDMYLFSVVLRAQTDGVGTMTFSNMRVLQHNGAGTDVDVSSVSRQISVVSGETVYADVPLIDTVGPEYFTPEVVVMDGLFEGKHVLVFATQDKGSGIAQYEVKEGMFGTYIEATSPYVIKDQRLQKKLYVKAIDKKGNARVVSVNPQYSAPWYKDYRILAILLVVCVSLYILKKKSGRLLKK